MTAKYSSCITIDNWHWGGGPSLHIHNLLLLLSCGMVMKVTHGMLWYMMFTAWFLKRQLSCLDQLLCLILRSTHLICRSAYLTAKVITTSILR